MSAKSIPSVAQLSLAPGGSRRLLGGLFVAYAVLVGAVLALDLAGVSVLDLFREPAEVGGFAGSEPWKGAAATLALFLWAGAAGACFLAGTALRLTRRDSRRGSFLVATAALALVFGVDDGLLVHDHLAERVTGSPLAQPLVSLALIAAGLAWFLQYRREIVRSQYLVLLLAALALGVSAVIDQRDSIGLGSYDIGLFEETMETIGILTFCVYCWTEALRALVEPLHGQVLHERPSVPQSQP